MAVRVKDGKLFFDFSWRGMRCKEYTGLPDTPENWRRCEQKMEAVRRAIARGTFDYRQHFPRGSRLHLFFPDNRIHDGAATNFADYITQWHKRRSPFLKDGSVGSDAELHPSTWIHDESVIRRHFIPAFGPLRLDEIDVARCREFRRSLIDAGLGGKTVGNIVGLLHKAFNDAVEEGLIERNPVLRASSRKLRSSRRQRLTADPLTPEEIHGFLARVHEDFRDFYHVWFQVGWRSSEIVALRFGWLDFVRKTIVLQRARIPRWGGVEAEPKTGRRLVDCSYAPEIFQTLERIRYSRGGVESDDFVFIDSRGRPLSQEWLNKRVWKPTLRRAGIRERGQYCIRDTFITLSLSAGEDPGWVARVCGTSEQMIFRHYRNWIPGLQTGAGSKINAALASILLSPDGLRPSLKVSLSLPEEPKSQQTQGLSMVEAGGIEPPSGFRACYRDSA
jgi:integrase